MESGAGFPLHHDQRTRLQMEGVYPGSVLAATDRDGWGSDADKPAQHMQLGDKRRTTGTEQTNTATGYSTFALLHSWEPS